MVVFFNGEEKVSKSLFKYSDVLHGFILLSPFFVLSHVLLLVLSHIIFGVVPFSLVVTLVPTSNKYIVMCRIVAACYISCVATQPHYISPLLSVA